MNQQELNEARILLSPGLEMIEWQWGNEVGVLKYWKWQDSHFL